MTSNHEPPKLIKKRLDYQGRLFSFEVAKFRLPNQVEAELESIRHPGGALAIPLTRDGKLILVKQYRFAVATRLLEFPAGTVEVNEDPAETVKREIEEETGYTAHSWQFIAKFPLAPGYSSEYIHAFLATDLEKLAQPPQQDIDEDIEVVMMTPQELEEAIHSGVGVDAKSIASLFLARHLLK
ncbi:MAG: NUDIX hydrolase [Gloeocapsa sp. DLM2.Bin57]|nr:MAG: NUDIX hydrolase [Gloeocapsa sp. DLM2.Bin57]